MFTLIRPIAAVILAIFAYFAAETYEFYYDPEAQLGNMPYVTAIVGAVVGYVFLGGRIGRALWFSIFMAWQAIALTAVGTSFVLGIREMFIQGYRRRYDEVTEAFAGLFGIMLDWLSRALVTDYLIYLGIGGTAIGVLLHIVWRMLETRRNDR